MTSPRQSKLAIRSFSVMFPALNMQCVMSNEYLQQIYHNVPYTKTAILRMALACNVAEGILEEAMLEQPCIAAGQ